MRTVSAPPGHTAARTGGAETAPRPSRAVTISIKVQAVAITRVAALFSPMMAARRSAGLRAARKRAGRPPLRPANDRTAASQSIPLRRDTAPACRISVRRYDGAAALCRRRPRCRWRKASRPWLIRFRLQSSQQFARFRSTGLARRTSDRADGGTDEGDPVWRRCYRAVGCQRAGWRRHPGPHFSHLVPRLIAAKRRPRTCPAPVDTVAALTRCWGDNLCETGIQLTTTSSYGRSAPAKSCTPSIDRERCERADSGGSPRRSWHSLSALVVAAG